LGLTRTPASMNYRKCNPLYGYRWFAEGAKLFLSQPWPWLALVGLTLLFLLVLSLLPLLGLIGIFTLFPGIAAGFLLASRAAMDRQPINFQHLLAGFKSAAKPLLAVGGMAFLIFFLALLFILFGWREEFRRLVELMQSPTPDKDALLTAAQQLTQPSLLVLGVMLLLAVATWFAPALVLFRQADARSAMVLSLRACLANFFPFLVFCVLLLLLDFATSLILRLLRALFQRLGNEQAANLAAMFFTFPIICGFMAIIFAAAYISYLDVFESQPQA
jgi:uncharacterized membrane protein